MARLPRPSQCQVLSRYSACPSSPARRPPAPPTPTGCSSGYPGTPLPQRCGCRRNPVRLPLRYSRGSAAEPNCSAPEPECLTPISTTDFAGSMRGKIENLGPYNPYDDGQVRLRSRCLAQFNRVKCQRAAQACVLEQSRDRPPPCSGPLREGCLDNLARMIGLLGRPVPETRAKTVRYGCDLVASRASGADPPCDPPSALRLTSDPPREPT